MVLAKKYPSPPNWQAHMDGHWIECHHMSLSINMYIFFLLLKRISFFIFCLRVLNTYFEMYLDFCVQKLFRYSLLVFILLPGIAVQCTIYTLHHYCFSVNDIYLWVVVTIRFFYLPVLKCIKSCRNSVGKLWEHSHTGFFSARTFLFSRSATLKLLYCEVIFMINRGKEILLVWHIVCIYWLFICWSSYMGSFQ